MRLFSLMASLTATDVEWMLNLNSVIGEDKIQDLKVSIEPERLIISGKFPTRIMYVPFTTFWQIGNEGLYLTFKLDKLEPINLLKDVLLEHLRNKWAIVSGDTIMFDLRRYLRTNNIPIEYDVCHIICLDQTISFHVRPYVDGA